MRVVFEDKDKTPVDLESSVPEEVLRDLLCDTREQTQQLVEMMRTISINISDMQHIMSENLPRLGDLIEDVMQELKENTKKGCDSATELQESISETVDALKEVAKAIIEVKKEDKK